MNNKAIGCDVGGSHISCAAVDLLNGSIEIGSFITQKVNNQGSAEEILKNWVSALQQTISKAGISCISGIGLAMPGPFEYHSGIARFVDANAKYQKLFGINVGEIIKKELKLTDVRFINDATAFAMGESWSGKASGAKRAVVITLGTGFGSAFLDNGIPVVEREDVPEQGCVWHLPFMGGIADDYFSSRWLVNAYLKKSGWIMAGAKEIAERVPADPRAVEVFEEFGRNLGLFLEPWLRKFRADVLVIGGNISKAYPVFGKSFEDFMTERSLQVLVHISELKENAAITGSARLLDEKTWLQVQPVLPKM